MASSSSQSDIFAQLDMANPIQDYPGLGFMNGMDNQVQDDLCLKLLNGYLYLSHGSWIYEGLPPVDETDISLGFGDPAAQEPAARFAAAVPESAEPVAEPAEPVAKPTEAVAKPAEAVAKPTEAVAEPAAASVPVPASSKRKRAPEEKPPNPPKRRRRVKPDRPRLPIEDLLAREHAILTPEEQQVVEQNQRQIEINIARIEAARQQELARGNYIGSSILVADD